MKNLKGFNMVEMPRNDIKPLQILATNKKNIVRKIGYINDIFKEHDYEPLPSIKKNIKVPSNIIESYIMNLDFDNKLILFNNLYELINGAKFSGNISKSDEFIISIKDAKYSEVSSEMNLSDYINSSELSENIGNYEKLLKKDEFYIITGILECKSFEIEIKDKNGVNVSAEASAETAGEIGSKLETKKESEKYMSHSGKTPLVIAFKAVKIFYERNFWSSRREANYRLKPKEHIIMRDEEDFPTVLLRTDNNFISWEE